MTTTVPVTPMASPSDLELARRAALGDDDALRALHTRHAGALRAFVRARVSDGADDLLQEAWTRIINGLETFDGESFRAWALGITRDVVVEPGGDTPFEVERQGLARCLAGLTRAELQVIRARLEGIDSARIAEKGAVSVERVHTLFLQAQASLAGCLEEMMAPLALDLPDEPAAMGPWLDRQLVGVQLGRLVAELEAVHGGRAGETRRAFEDVLSDQLPTVLDSGLGALSRLTLREVLRQPRLLLELQERVLRGGGPYWTQLQADDQEVSRAVNAGWLGVQSLRSTPAATRERQPPEQEPDQAQPASVPAPALAPTPTPAATRAPDRPPRVVLLRVWARTATVAASTLLFLYLAEHLDPHPPLPDPSHPPTLPADPFAPRAEWGWNRPGVLDGSGSGKVSNYLTVLAESVSEWFEERPFTPSSFALRLGALRTGCSRLIVSRHEKLSPAERDWLVEHGREWAGQLDAAVHALERGDPVERVSTDVDATVNRMIDALRERARSA